ncbi:MAG: hypothetical protein HY341_02280 [Candidatus Kerfeldbacteria bacterium]|nr:hypothetical protein [Candidatus Kerfeldbacteria bacterium]
MKPTDLLYLHDMGTLSLDAHVVGMETAGGQSVIILDQTVFYPQGGGQPYDQGTIESTDGTFRVEEVRFVDGIVRHIGSYTTGGFSDGQTVACSVDPERRRLHSRIHSAGHLVDMAVHALALPWKPGKGYHFPDGPYVEYEGSLDTMVVEQLKRHLEETMDRFVKEALPVTVQFLPRDQMVPVCAFVPDNIPTNKPSRVVVFGTFGVPCGGTHVHTLADLGMVSIRKIKQRGATVRVGYDVS